MLAAHLLSLEHNSTSKVQSSNEKHLETQELKGNDPNVSTDQLYSKNKFTIISSGIAKDKKTLEKESRTCQKRINLFFEDIVGSPNEKRFPVLATDLPFRCLRNFGSIISECSIAIHDAQLLQLGEELRNFLEVNTSYRRSFKAILEKMKLEECPGGSLVHIYLYSMTDDRFDMISYSPHSLAKLLDSNFPQTSRQSTSGNGSTNSVKGKSKKSTI